MYDKIVWARRAVPVARNRSHAKRNFGLVTRLDRGGWLDVERYHAPEDIRMEPHGDRHIAEI